MRRERMTIGNTRQKLVNEYREVKKALEQHDDIEDVGISVGMPMEFDPRKGETPIPDGVGFSIPHQDFDLIRHISDVCEEYDMKVKMPDFKQPGFTYKGKTYEKDYEAFVRLTPQR
jgi:hypothetical protein